MACENRNCGNCDCGPEDETATTKPMLKEFPIAQKRDVVYVEREKSSEWPGFWAFFWGALFGGFFMGC